MRRGLTACLERWYGAETLEALSGNMKGWYGNPIPVGGSPCSVKVGADGDFQCKFTWGRFASKWDFYEDLAKRAVRKIKNMGKNQLATVQMAGLSGLADLLEVSRTNTQVLPFIKTSTSAAIAGVFNLYLLSPSPQQGLNGLSAPDGRDCVSTDTGALPLTNPGGSERMYVAGGGVQRNGSTNPTGFATLLLHDRLFSVLKTPSSVASEAITGVPSRYQNTSSTAEDSAVSNFWFPEVSSALGTGAHTWTGTYTSSDGVTGKTLPAVTGNASTAASRLDMQTSYWFGPLDTGDRGIKALTAMQCNASITGGVNFVIAHPLSWFVTTGFFYMFDLLIGGFQLTRVYNNACLSLLKVGENSVVDTLSGYINIVSR